MGARQGKIARLPAVIRDELNRRLLDGQNGRKILEWLNAHDQVKAVLEEDFEGLRVNDANLSDWRQGGYQDWLKRRENLERTKELARYAAEQTRAKGASIADGAAAIASGKLLELLEAVDEATLVTDDKGEKHLPVKQIVAITSALGSLRTSEQNDIRLKQNDRRLDQKDEALALEREKFQRDTAGIALKIISDQRAREIEAGSGTNAEKIELMGQHIFGDLWKQAK